MENERQPSGNEGKRKPLPHAFKPGNSGGPGRPRKPPEVRALERLSKAQITQRLEEMVSPTLSRLLTLVEQKDDPATALRAAALLLDRVVGPVPSAQYLQANINGNSGGVVNVTADMIIEMARRTVARADAKNDVIEHRP